MIKSSHPLYCHDTSLAVLKASGSAIRKYLQSQMTQDIKKLAPESPIYTAVLTPQGKMVADMHIIDAGDELIMVTQKSYAVILVERLRRFALGYDIRLGLVESLGVLSIQGEETISTKENIQQNIQKSTQWPIHASMMMAEASDTGSWLIMDTSDMTQALNHLGNPCDLEDMNKARIIFGTPRFGTDWDESIHPLNANLIEMQGVSFDKGCYVGQEVTSRMHWRKGIKKKLYHVAITGKLPTAPCPILTSLPIGTLTSCAQNEQGQSFGIAHLPISSIEAESPFTLENAAKLTIIKACHA